MHSHVYSAKYSPNFGNDLMRCTIEIAIYIIKDTMHI